MAARTPLILNQSTARVEELAAADTIPGAMIEGLIGRNALINGDFRVWQRGTNFPAATGQRYTADRWQVNAIGSTIWIQRVDIPPGGGAVPMLQKSKYMLQAIVSSVAGAGNFALFQQRIEGVRQLSGKTVTVSFKAKASIANFKVGVEFQQSFGNTGSAGVDSLNASVTLGTDWQEYAVQIALPSVVGKTIVDNDYLQLSFWLDAGANFAGRSLSAGQKCGTVSVTEVQVEDSNVATAFEYRPDAHERMLCDRYCQLLDFGNGNGFTLVMINGVNSVLGFLPLQSPMRAVPTATRRGDFPTYTGPGSGSGSTLTGLTIIPTGVARLALVGTISVSGTVNQVGYLGSTSTNGFQILLDAEL